MLASTLIAFLSGAIFGACIGAEIQRRITAKKRDELGFHLAKTVAHDPQEAARMVV